MVIMALDHTRDYFSNFGHEPTDLAFASTGMFFTRWITHYCAPVFVFLAGCSAHLAQSSKKTLKQTATQLLTRGLWLVLVEVTIVRLGWAFDIDYSIVFLQVIWALGCSMILLSGLIFLPLRLILAIGLVIVFGHNMLDGIKAQQMGAYGNLWEFLHQQGPVKYGNGNTIMVFYPLIPWVGLMPLGYCFGAVMKMPEAQRNRWLYGIGGTATILFIVLRYINIYGDPAYWHAQTTLHRTVLSFLNTTKYPPSLLYLLMTLGPAITALPLLEQLQGPAAQFFTVYGRVPFFYYVLHIYLIHSIAQLVGIIEPQTMIKGITMHPGFALPVVYAYWITVVLLLYYPCRWFMRYKMSHKKWWLSYI